MGSHFSLCEIFGSWLPVVLLATLILSVAVLFCVMSRFTLPHRKVSAGKSVVEAVVEERSSVVSPVDILKEDFGYEFVNGKLVKVESGEPFEFEVEKGNRAYNQKHYEELGEVITEYVFELLEKEAQLDKIEIPIDAEPDEVRGFFFASPGAWKKKKLLVLIHGTGVVKAGQWSRKLIINDGLERGTQLPFIRKAKERKYGVVVLNTNLNRRKDKNGELQFIRGSGNSVIHAQYVWENWILESKAKKIAIVAHSAGGYDTVKLADNFAEDFGQRVFAVCLTDSAHLPGKKIGWELLKKVGRNWVTSTKAIDTVLPPRRNDIQIVSAGVDKHEETSPAAMESIFEYIDQKEAEFSQRRKVGSSPVRTRSTSRGRKAANESEVRENVGQSDTATKKEL